MPEEFDNWEEVPDEDLWMDGELTRDDLMECLYKDMEEYKEEKRR